MLHVEECVLVLLAAGQSQRFDDARSKLDQDLLGQPLGLHAVLALAAVPFRERVAVTGRLDLHYDRHGFTTIHNPAPAAGMAGSIKLGVSHAVAAGAASVMVVLADMPRVTAAHIHRLFEASGDAETVVASSDGRHATPPALFGAGRFAALLGLDGSAGARDLVHDGVHVVATPAELIDVDTVTELEALRALAHATRR